MCGRKTLTANIQSIIEYFAVEEWENPDSYIPSYNIAPTQTSPILLQKGERIIKPMRWGLIPSWAKDNKFASKMINARAETLLEKPSFKKLVGSNRCIVVADGYYEWKTTENRKVPYYFRSLRGELLPMAGIWDNWKNPDGETVFSYIVITTNSNKELSNIHNRMPVIIPNANIDIWLKDNVYSSLEALELINKDDLELEYYPVSDFVNHTRNNSKKCIERI